MCFWVLISGSFINRTVDDSGIVSVAINYGEDEIKNLDLSKMLAGEDGEGSAEIPEEVFIMKDLIVKEIDFDFVEEQLDNTIKTSILFITGESERLPVIKFGEFFDMFYDGFISIMIMKGNAQDTKEIREMAKDEIGKILNIQNVKDEINLKEELDIIYGVETNPATNFQNIIKGYKRIVNYYYPIIILLILLLIVLVAFRPKWIFGWLAPPAIISGFFILITGLITRAPGAFIQSNYQKLMQDVQMPEFIREPVMFIANGFINKIASVNIIWGAALFVAGIVFIIISASIPGRNRRMQRYAAAGYAVSVNRNSGGRALGVLVRFVAFVIVGILIYHNINLAQKNMMRRVDKFNESIEYVQNQIELDTNTILSQLTGLDFNQLMGGK
jgi:hypothetical protein